MLRRILASLSFSLLFWASDALPITSGWPATDKEFQSAVQIWTIAGGKSKYLCTGVAIAPDTIATTASCIHSENPSLNVGNLIVSTASKINYSHPLEQSILSISAIAKKGVLHEEKDLILIFLKQPLNIEPALLLLPGEAFQLRMLPQVIVAGYGSREKFKKKPAGSWGWGDETKLELGEKYLARSQVAAVSTFEIQIGKIEEDSSACLGDEGSPVYAHIDSRFKNAERVIGIVAKSDKLKDCARPTSTLRLDALRDFIDETMSRECQNGARSWCKHTGLLKPGYDEESVLDKIVVTEPTVSNKEKVEEEYRPIPKATPASPNTIPAKAVQTPQKRRLNVTPEAAGCSCQQVFTKPS